MHDLSIDDDDRVYPLSQDEEQEVIRELVFLQEEKLKLWADKTWPVSEVDIFDENQFPFVDVYMVHEQIPIQTGSDVISVIECDIPLVHFVFHSSVGGVVFATTYLPPVDPTCSDYIIAKPCKPAFGCLVYTFLRGSKFRQRGTINGTDNMINLLKKYEDVHDRFIAFVQEFVSQQSLSQQPAFQESAFQQSRADEKN